MVPTEITILVAIMLPKAPESETVQNIQQLISTASYNWTGEMFWGSLYERGNIKFAAVHINEGI